MKKKIKMTPELQRIMQDQLSAFKKKFGRAPGPDDPVFFDPDADTPRPISEAKLRRLLTKVAEEAGLDPNRVLATFGFEE